MVGPLVDRLDSGDEPLFIADLDDGAGGEGFSLTELESLRRHQLTSWEVVHYIRHRIPPWLERPTPVHFHPGPLRAATRVHRSAQVNIPTLESHNTAERSRLHGALTSIVPSTFWPEHPSQPETKVAFFSWHIRPQPTTYLLHVMYPPPLVSRHSVRPNSDFTDFLWFPNRRQRTK